MAALGCGFVLTAAFCIVVLLPGMVTNLYSDRTLTSGFCGRYVPDGLPASVNEIGLSVLIHPSEIEVLEETIALAVATSLSKEGDPNGVVVAHVANTTQVEETIHRVWKYEGGRLRNVEIEEFRERYRTPTSEMPNHAFWYAFHSLSPDQACVEVDAKYNTALPEHHRVLGISFGSFMSMVTSEYSIWELQKSAGRWEVEETIYYFGTY